MRERHDLVSIHFSDVHPAALELFVIGKVLGHTPSIGIKRSFLAQYIDPSQDWTRTLYKLSVKIPFVPLPVNYASALERPAPN